MCPLHGMRVSIICDSPPCPGPGAVLIPPEGDAVAGRQAIGQAPLPAALQGMKVQSRQPHVRGHVRGLERSHGPPQILRPPADQAPGRAPEAGALNLHSPSSSNDHCKVGPCGGAAKCRISNLPGPERSRLDRNSTSSRLLTDRARARSPSAPASLGGAALKSAGSATPAVPSRSETRTATARDGVIRSPRQNVLPCRIAALPTRIAASKRLVAPTIQPSSRNGKNRSRR